MAAILKVWRHIIRNPTSSRNP